MGPIIGAVLLTLYMFVAFFYQIPRSRTLENFIVSIVAGLVVGYILGWIVELMVNIIRRIAAPEKVVVKKRVEIKKDGEKIVEVEKVEVKKEDI